MLSYISALSKPLLLIGDSYRGIFILYYNSTQPKYRHDLDMKSPVQTLLLSEEILNW